MKKTNKIIVQWRQIWVKKIQDSDYISLTDIAKKKWDKPDLIIQNWIRTQNTLLFLWKWEELFNQNFNPFIFEGIKNDSFENSFIMTPKKWIESTNSIGIISKPGRYWGTYAHSDIAFKFASWISVEFELYIIQEFQRLKSGEQEKLSVGWDVKRELAKVNYKIHTDAIKDYLLPTLSELKKRFAYADEADFLNVLIFWKTAKQWMWEHPDILGNMRDHASALDLIILANIENFNAQYIEQWLSQEERYQKLKAIIMRQRKSLENRNFKKLEK